MRSALVLVILLSASEAAADVVSLRSPMTGGRSVTIELGYPSTALSLWLNDWLGVGVFARIPLSSVGAQLGLRRAFVGDLKLGWALEGIAALGVEFTTVTVAFVADITGTLRVRYIGPWFLTAFGVTAPLSFRLTDNIQAKLPVMGELWLGGHSGALWVALHGGVGASFMVGYSASPALQLGVVVGLDF